MNLDFRTGILKVIQSGTILVRAPNGGALGTGFLVKESGLIVTCAHVVRSGQDAYFDEVDVEFTAGNRRVKAQVLTDFIDAEADVAFLEVGDDIPEECNSLPLGTSEGRTEHEYQSYGFPDIRKWSGGLLSRGMIVGTISDSHGRHLLQLSQSVETKPGFSGAPVWDVRAGLVVGMVAGGVGATRDGSGMPIPVAVTCEAIVAKNPQLKQVPFSIYGKSFQMIEQQTNAFLTSEQGLFIHGGFIHRNESTKLIDALMSGHGGNTAVLLGESGIGKSALLTNIIEEVRAREWPVLAFSLNSVAESVSVTDQLGRQLGLDASPAAVLAEAAGSHKCLIVIDQVDFASRVSGNYPQLKKAVRLLREEAARHPKMRLLFACRGSDYENDIELKEAIKSPKGLSPITLSALTHEIVVDIVARWGWANIAKSLTKKQLDLLSVPLHLRLFRECCDSGDTQLLDFHTSLDLFDKYWAAKQRSIEEHRGRPVAWWDIVKKLAEHMSNEQLLRAPAAILGKDAEDAEVMVSEHVLVREGQHFRFFHESFFDYAFARVFVPERKPVSDLLLGGEQQLFRRSQVRFILSFEREKHREAYERDLKSVFLSPHVRHHVKSAVLDLLKKHSDPTKFEWETLLDGIRFGSLRGQDMWQTIHGSRSWFELLDKQRTLEEWLADISRRQRAIFFLSSVQEEVPDRVVQIIESLAEPLESWRDELILLLDRSDVFVSRLFFEFFLRILDAGILDGIKPSGSFIAGFWSFVHIPRA
ncbi:MAG: trypsin-like peptidase domain-containing protein [Desulfomonilaceae bacterium]